MKKGSERVYMGKNELSGLLGSMEEKPGLMPCI